MNNNSHKYNTISKLDKKLTTYEKEIFANNKFPAMCGRKYEPAIFPDVPRIIVLGDIHGDYQLAIELLMIAEVIPKSSNIPTIDQINWIGGANYVVQVGDQVDRCRPINNMLCNNPATTIPDEASDLKILALFTKLNDQAMQVGGRVISLLGNHELLNSTGFVQYVSYAGLQEFVNYKRKDGSIVQSGEEGRKEAFAPGNQWGSYLGCTRYACVMIGTHLFVHAGIVNGLIEELGIKGTMDLETINMAIRMWLLGLLNKKYLKTVLKSSNTSMFWTRFLSKIPPNISIDHPACSTHLDKVLKIFKCDSMMIAHTPMSFEFNDDINQTCSGRVFRTDAGSSAAFNAFDHQYIMTKQKNHARRAQILVIEHTPKQQYEYKYTVKDSNGIVVEYLQQCKVNNNGDLICGDVVANRK